jgi:uncharacterized protein
MTAPLILDGFVGDGLVARTDGPEAGIAAGVRIRLRGSRCPRCGRVDFPAADLCTGCSATASPEALPCDGELTGFTSINFPPPDAATMPTPYCVGVVRLQGQDLCVLGLLEGDLESLRIGDPVETVAREPIADVWTYAFRPIGRARPDET